MKLEASKQLIINLLLDHDPFGLTVHELHEVMPYTVGRISDIMQELLREQVVVFEPYKSAGRRYTLSSAYLQSQGLLLEEQS